jgi:hypothetical protein
MRLREAQIAEKSIMLGVMAAYAAGALILASVLVATSLWPGVPVP